MIGTSVSHYRVLEKIGEGGMGAVFLAQDDRLKRKVALKVLPERVTSDRERRQRFVTEARAAAGIDHPNIAAIYEIDEHEGQTFIAMEYVRGRSLREVISKEEPTVLETLEISVQAAEALAKAHELGIVHRDLKPENILVSEDGYAKVIDFGLAKLLETEVAGGSDAATELDPALLSELDTLQAGGDPLVDDETTMEGQTILEPSADDVADTLLRLGPQMRTRAGAIMGTVDYMSPEQAKGEPVDERSDVFSFGIVLYEMLSGSDPFKKPTPVETLSAILYETPEPVHMEHGWVPPELRRILARALAKNKDDRYRSMSELAGDLRQVLDSMRGGWRSLLSGKRLVAAVALLAVLIGTTWWLAQRGRVPEVVEIDPVSVLIADFVNQTGDPVFDGAVEQALGIGLEGAPFITTYQRPRARRQAAQLNPDSEGRLDAETTQLVSRSQGIQVAVEGSIEARGDGYEIGARAFDVETSETLVEASSRAKSKAEVLQAADKLSRQLRKGLGDVTFDEGEPLPEETITTASLEAMNSYVQAQEHLSLGQYPEALEKYRTSIEQDTQFGRSYAGLAVLLYNQGEREEAEARFNEALANIDRMSDREKYRTRGAYFVTTGNFPKAIEEFSTLVEQYPADSAGHGNLALAYFYARDMEKAAEHGQRSLEVYPTNTIFKNNLALYAMYAGDFETAEREALEVLELNPEFAKAYIALGVSQAAQGRVEEAEETYHQLVALGGRGASLGRIALADLFLFQGRVADAAPVLSQGIEDDLAAELGPYAAVKMIMSAEANALLNESEVALRDIWEALNLSQRTSIQVPAGRIYIEADREMEALGIAEQLVKRRQADSRAYAKLIESQVALAQSKSMQALTLAEEAQATSDTWLGRLTLGRAYLAIEAWAEAYSELEICLNRRGEATAVFLDDMPTSRVLPQVYFLLGQAQEGLGSPAAAESYQTFLDIKQAGLETQMVVDARARLADL